MTKRTEDGNSHRVASILDPVRLVRDGWPRLLFLFAIGVVLLGARNPDPLLNPAVFAEDGVWVGMALTNGWFQTLAEARTDYLVLGNILLLYLATKLSWVLSGNDLTVLPEAIAMISYSFYSAVATGAFAVTKDMANRPTRIALFLLLLLIPLGTTQNEVIGRIVQVGFYMPFITVLLLLSRERRDSLRWCVAHDLGLFICAATNPMAVAIVFPYLAWTFMKRNAPRAWARRNGLLGVALLLLIAFLIPRLGGKGGLPVSFDASGVVAAVLARPIAYPFVFPFYPWLSDVWAIAFVALWLAFVGVCCAVSSNKLATTAIVASVLVLALQDAATIGLRPGVTSILAGYKTSFPDRYFMGMNVFVSFATALSIGQLLESRFKRAGQAAFGAIALLYFASLPLIFEFRAPRYPIRTGMNFPEQLCASAIVENGAFALIQIYPLPWTMSVPASRVSKAYCDKGNGLFTRLRFTG